MTQPYTGYTPPAYPTTPVPIEEPSAAVEAIELLIKAGMAGLFVAFLLLMLVFLLRQFLLISRPNEALVFSGKKSRGPNGETLPYAIVKQGARGIHAPGVVETISSARSIAPFIPFSRGVRSKLAP